MTEFIAKTKCIKDNCEKHIICECNCHNDKNIMHIRACCSTCMKCGKKNVLNPSIMVKGNCVPHKNKYKHY